MQVRVRNQPSFAVARLMLAPGEPCQVESGAMMATSYGVQVQSQAQGGIMKGLGRAFLSGESFFISTFTAPQNGGWVDVAANLPGDIQTITLDGRTGWAVTRGCWLASSHGVQTETKWGGMKNLMGGEGGFLTHATGQGELLVSCYGAVETMTLQPGEMVTVDTGHVVAYADTVQYQIRKVATGIIQSMKSGEGLVFDFVGPGQIMTQTRNPSALISWIISHVPSR
ncbi:MULTISPECIES: TIGR00266 family protein [unclassified Amycolatopsis]|uniref:TIGR00266 family protein n=1 Tax=unclassified Amycolatopsis TaxID=2618356 RepID=UPI001FF3CADB|nr:MULTISPECIES: TIGR00266 family protein [unclassified Amycolatopsis]UOZ08171.1 TIGR00266 family protein [Amycolatopsis sp. WQ 127309]WSJ74434.1 TIGR00266 family protein [Amycolatopsis sp. NBC_01307]WSK81918.1 TIGR00266 family protein [Amycolatopsis sp. NBC_01286]